MSGCPPRDERSVGCRVRVGGGRGIVTYLTGSTASCLCCTQGFDLIRVDAHRYISRSASSSSRGTSTSLATRGLGGRGEGGSFVALRGLRLVAAFPNGPEQCMAHGARTDQAWPVLRATVSSTATMRRLLPVGRRLLPVVCWHSLSPLDASRAKFGSPPISLVFRLP